MIKGVQSAYFFFTQHDVNALATISITLNLEPISTSSCTVFNFLHSCRSCYFVFSIPTSNFYKYKNNPLKYRNRPVILLHSLSFSTIFFLTTCCCYLRFLRFAIIETYFLRFHLLAWRCRLQLTNKCVFNQNELKCSFSHILALSSISIFQELTLFLNRF